MKKHFLNSLCASNSWTVIAWVIFCLTGSTASAQPLQAQNPIIHADVPDMSMIRVGSTYYMSSTTMHMSPGVPIMKSEDLVNWKLVNYAYDVLDSLDALTLSNNQNSYGRGSWASCLRYHDGMYYVSTFAQTTKKTYIFSTPDIENGPWKVSTFAPAYHDHSLFFHEDGKIYMIWGNGKLMIAELEKDLSGVKQGTERVLIENASAVAGQDIMLGAEGSQLFYVKGKYYLLNIVWPQGGMRTVITHRADHITGPYESKVTLQDKGVAQGGLIDTPTDEWFAYLFRDYGAVGRIPYLVPLTWEDGWPVFGTEGEVPEQLALTPSSGLIPGIVASDEFVREANEPDLPLVWQWNHNPDPHFWSLTARKGFLRLSTHQLSSSLLNARNTLTQRTIGPSCAGSSSLDLSGMKDGDVAGLALLQRKYGFVGVKKVAGNLVLITVNAESESPVEIEHLPLTQETVWLRIDCDFNDRKDLAYFSYSLNGKSWSRVGSELKMDYTLPHFMGYRFGLFNYATLSPGGFVDFDYFHFHEEMNEDIEEDK